MSKVFHSLFPFTTFLLFIHQKNVVYSRPNRVPSQILRFKIDSPLFSVVTFESSPLKRKKVIFTQQTNVQKSFKIILEDIKLYHYFKHDLYTILPNTRLLCFQLIAVLKHLSDCWNQNFLNINIYIFIVFSRLRCDVLLYHQNQT